MPEVLIKPTIGRRIWYWPGYLDLAVLESPMRLILDQDVQPFDAGVIYVHSDTYVNLQVTDHRGGIWFREKVRILQEGEDLAAIHENGVAQWMHYQAGQAAREKGREAAQAPSAPPILRGPGMCMGERCQEHAGTDHSPECLAETALAQKWPEDREWRRVMAQASRAYVKRDEELLNAGRVTYEFLQGEIARRFFFTAESALGEVAHNGMGLDMVTICVLVLHNGVKYVGVNYGSVVPEHFNKERGMSMAAEEAEQTLRAALTLRLRELQHRARVKA